MLLDVTAFPTPAMALGLAGALGMSALVPGAALAVTPADVSEALARPAVVSVATPAASFTGGGSSAGGVTGVPQPFVGPDPVGGGPSLETIARFDGVTLLDQLVRLTPGERDDFVQSHADAITGLVSTPPAASAVQSWWARTPAAQRASLAADLPGMVGNLEGVPYAVRDDANRAYLTSTVFGIRAQLDAGVGRAMEDELQGRLRMLSSIEEALRTGDSGEERTLVSLDVAGNGRAVIAIGDLTDAEYVTFFVPGMYIGVADQLVDWTDWADASRTEQLDWLDRLDTEGDGHGDVATVAWIGYETPTLVTIAGLDLAYQGRDSLTSSLQGLDAVRSGGTDPYVTIAAHSYGSTAAMLALQENNVSVDALVLVGSPGSPATNVSDLKVAGGNVWVAAAEGDPVPASGVFGSQPLDTEFGAHRFSVKGMTDPVTGESLEGISGHVYYFWPGTTAVRNTALIALGQGALVTTDTGLARAISR